MKLANSTAVTHCDDVAFSFFFLIKKKKEQLNYFCTTDRKLIPKSGTFLPVNSQYSHITWAIAQQWFWWTMQQKHKMLMYRLCVHLDTRKELGISKSTAPSVQYWKTTPYSLISHYIVQCPKWSNSEISTSKTFMMNLHDGPTTELFTITVYALNKLETYQKIHNIKKTQAGIS